VAEVRSIKEQEERAMHRNVLRVLATMLVMLGLLTLGVTPAVAQEELTVEVTFDQATIDPRTGEVTLTGTVTCSEYSEFVFVRIYGQLVQSVGRGGVWAPFDVLVAPCTPEEATFSKTFTAVAGRLRPGWAHLTAAIFGCAPTYPTNRCDTRFFEQLDTTIQLTPAR
jgi:hypothetical protein